ncbi:MAG: hypothetical protein OXE75_11765 [bacterium]|nr:hypothetical protein [bacterium]
MTLHELARTAFDELNDVLCSEGEAARVRYFWIEPDYDCVDEWMICAIWELPPHGGECWPLEVLDKYRRCTREAIGDAAFTHSLFRTSEQLADPAHQRGVQLQPA